MKSCITLSLVPEARGGPFVFWDGLAGACAAAGKLGFDAIEIFAPGPEALDRNALRDLLAQNRLALAALGTGGGWVRHKLSLTSPSAEIRQRGRDFILRMMDLAAEFGAAVIIGSMQGRWDAEVSRDQALDFLRSALAHLSQLRPQSMILYEHLNRYETNLLNRIEEVVPFLQPLSPNVKMLADLFHMNIEEENLAEALRLAGDRLGHVHFVDSNRRAPGMGHTDFAPIFGALRQIKYGGYLSAEAVSYPEAQRAAEQTIKTFRKFAQ